MDADCGLCHGGEGDLVLDSSDGTDTNPGIGCVGCHGRPYDGFGDSAVGLRMHHFNSGVTSCAGCHSNDPEPLPEDVLPTYYGTIDTNVDDPCNLPPSFLENYSIGDTQGLDNDGDLDYDEADTDCGECVGDLDGNGFVDVTDLLALLGNWDGTGDGDLNGDGIVDVGDLLILLAAWGEC
jgi:hypothetical protein